MTADSHPSGFNRWEGKGGNDEKEVGESISNIKKGM